MNKNTQIAFNRAEYALPVAALLDTPLDGQQRLELSCEGISNIDGDRDG